MIKLENDAVWVYADGAEGLRWYRFADADEPARDLFGRETGETLQEAFAAGRLRFTGEALVAD